MVDRTTTMLCCLTMTRQRVSPYILPTCGIALHCRNVIVLAERCELKTIPGQHRPREGHGHMMACRTVQ